MRNCIALWTCLALIASAPAVAAPNGGAKPCKILLTDDDGVTSPGLLAAYRGLADMCDLAISAPGEDRSGASHSVINTKGPLPARKVMLAPGISAYSVDGSPAEAVALGLLALQGDRPFDLTVSGINAGGNTGDTNLYSGTVNAAMEAVVRGVPGIAVSAARGQLGDYRFAVAVLREIVVETLRRGLPKGTMLNVNIPDPPVGGVEISHAAGETYSLEGFDATAAGPEAFLYKPRIKPRTMAAGSGDTAAFQAGMITITPLKLDRTDYDAIGPLRGWDLKVPAAPADGH